MAKLRAIKEFFDTTYDAADVETGINYWRNKLLNICLQLFQWDGLPDSLPQRELELHLILYGYATIFEHSKNGLVVAPSSIFGDDLYFNPYRSTWSQPVLGSGTLNIGTGGEVIYNSELQYKAIMWHTDGGMKTFIDRYARMLADIESTISIYTVNCRITDYAVAKNDKVKNGLKAFFDKIKAGHREIIGDEQILAGFQSIPRAVSSATDKIGDLLIARDKILEMFYRDLGVQMYQPKKAQVTEDEVEANNQVLVISTDDMLEERKAGADRVNVHYGTNISVKLNPKFDVRNMSVPKEAVKEVEADVDYSER